MRPQQGLRQLFPSGRGLAEPRSSSAQTGRSRRPRRETGARAGSPEGRGRPAGAGRASRGRAGGRRRVLRGGEGRGRRTGVEPREEAGPVRGAGTIRGAGPADGGAGSPAGRGRWAGAGAGAGSPGSRSPACLLAAAQSQGHVQAPCSTGGDAACPEREQVGGPAPGGSGSFGLWVRAPRPPSAGRGAEASRGSGPSGGRGGSSRGPGGP